MFERNGVEVINRDAMADEELPKADAITMFHVVEHLPNSPKALFGRCMTALPSGGAFVIAVPNAKPSQADRRSARQVKWSTMVDWDEQPKFRAHVREADVSDLRYIAADLGLASVEVRGRNFLRHAQQE